LKKVKFGRRERLDFSRIPAIMEMPDLIEVQRKSYDIFLQTGVPADSFLDTGLQSVFTSVFPIWDYNEASSLEFVSYSLLEPKYTVRECQERGMTYAVPLKVTLRLVIREQDPETGVKKVKDIREQEVFLCDLPMMTERGTFVINGAERVIVSQLHRSPGVAFDEDEGKVSLSGKKLYMASVIPYHGSWLEFEFDAAGTLYARIDRKRKFLATTLLRGWGFATDSDILSIFYDSETIDVDLKKLLGKAAAADVVDPVHRRSHHGDRRRFHARSRGGIHQKRKVTKVKTVASALTDTSILNTLRRDNTHSVESALVEIYKKMRPGDPPTLENAKALMDSMFFNKKRYDLAKVGRYKINKKFSLKTSLDQRTLTQEDIRHIVRHLLDLCNGKGEKDDIDHSGQSSHPLGGRTSRKQDASWFDAYGTRGARTHVHRGHGNVAHAEPAHLHQAHHGGRQGVLRDFPAVAVHGPDQPAGGTDAQAAPLSPRAGWFEPRTRRVRSARRSPYALRSSLPDRNAGRPEHRFDRLLGHLCQAQ
jgi:DNA-directed RNA polymerase subunit beta